MLSGVPVSSCAAGLHFILQGNSTLLLTTSPEAFPWNTQLLGGCHLPGPQASPSRASTREAGRLPPGCPDTGSARAQHTHCTQRTNKSGGPSAVPPARHSHGRWLTSLHAQTCSTAQDCALLRDLDSTDWISAGIHVAALISLDLPVIQAC